MWHSKRRAVRKSRSSTRLLLQQAERTTAGPGIGITGQVTTPPSSTIQTATTSRPFGTTTARRSESRTGNQNCYAPPPLFGGCDGHNEGGASRIIRRREDAEGEGD